MTRLQSDRGVAVRRLRPALQATCAHRPEPRCSRRLQIACVACGAGKILGMWLMIPILGAAGGTAVAVEAAEAFAAAGAMDELGSLMNLPLSVPADRAHRTAATAPLWDSSTNLVRALSWSKQPCPCRCSDAWGARCVSRHVRWACWCCKRGVSDHHWKRERHLPVWEVFGCRHVSALPGLSL